MGKGIWQFKTDDVKAQDGVWVAYPEPGADVQFCVRYARNNMPYATAVSHVQRKFKNYLNMTHAQAPEKGKEMNADMVKAFVDHVLIDWRGEDIIDEKSGEKIAFTKKAALNMLVDLPDVYDWLTGQAADSSLFRVDIDLEEEAKN